MTVTPSQINAGRTLATVLAERGKLPIATALALVRSLALQTVDLHDARMIHGAIGPATILLDDRDVPRLELPTSGALLQLAGEWAGLFTDLSCLEPVTLPVSVVAARQRFQEVGITFDPRQIDLRQLGALWCRVLTGESAGAYLRSPRVKGLVPAELRPLLERALGSSGREPFADASEFAEALRVAAAKFAPPPTVTGAEGPAADEVPPLSPTPAQATSDTTPSFVTSANQSPDTSIAPGQSSLAARAPATTNTADEPLPFSRLGHYEIVRRIGRGGMGDVYLGYEAALDRKVAIKVLPADLARSEDFVRRFRTEATAVAKLNHPNIVPIHLIGEDQGHHFYVMQFVEGESLADRLGREARLGVVETLKIVEQALAGLAAAHDQGMVHRDIKPGNILLDSRSGRALLADFGLVKSLETSAGGKTATGVIMGTVDYISPEQGRGRTVDRRSDLYSIGVLLYRMLSGQLPFTADSPTALIFQHVYESPPELQKVALTCRRHWRKWWRVCWPSRPETGTRRRKKCWPMCGRFERTSRSCRRRGIRPECRRRSFVCRRSTKNRWKSRRICRRCRRSGGNRPAIVRSACSAVMRRKRSCSCRIPSSRWMEQSPSTNAGNGTCRTWPIQRNRCWLN